ncbi:MAG: pyruvate kinase [Bacteroidetes bacterium]|nr:pyruvate kinase [Bacteroidota bacterium]
MIPFNKTKIIATIGPASSSPEVLEELMRAGVDVCRLNFSHGNYEDHEQVIIAIREISKRTHMHAAILVDLQGPKLRIGMVENDAALLENGNEVTLTTKECIGTSERLYINYAQLPADAKEGEIILIDDGKIKLRVSETNYKDEVKAIVENGGIVSSRKGVNLPNTKVSLPSLTEKDLQDLDFAIKMNVDWIGLSFVRKASDITALRQIIAKEGKQIKVVAKIEKPEALEDIDHIIHETDALMVARGDLGVELPMQDVPLIQKMLVKKCIRATKPVIIATQMMESMINNSSPTRAEVNDVANSVLDGADAVMLSGETSVGKFPVKVVEYMRNVVTSIEEKGFKYNREQLPDVTSSSYLSDAVCYNACVMASQVGAKAIVGMTRSGYTAFKVSSQRPRSDIFIFTDRPSLLAQLSLVWGVRGFFYESEAGANQTINELQEMLKLKGYLEVNDIVINLASMPFYEGGRTNMIKINKVK